MSSAKLHLDHLAFPSFDAGETYRFYTEVMGLSLVFAMEGDAKAWKARSFLLTSFAIGDGRVLDFFEYDGIKRPGDDGLPKDIRHVAMAVESSDALEAWKRRLEAHAVSYWTEEHGPKRESIYFSDPNGVLIELTDEAASASPERASVARAVEVVRKWTAARGQRAVR
jgi:glyoxylase I family protein